MIAPSDAVLTIVARNYLAYAKTLFESLRRTNPDIALFLVVIDAGDELQLEDAFADVQRIDAESLLGRPRYRRMARSYDVVEFSTAVKPFALRAMLKAGCERAYYFDPDVLVLRSIESIIAAQRGATVTLVPHFAEPVDADGCLPDERTMLLCGTYNLGYIGVRTDPETSRFLDWWCDRVESHCLRDIANGLFVDQRWLDLAPGMFDGVRILRQHGLNVAYWNLAIDPLDEQDETRLRSMEPITFMHFSGFDPYNPSQLSRFQNRITVSEASALQRRLHAYARSLFQNGHDLYARIPYAFDRDDCGFTIDRYARFAVRAEPDLAAAESLEIALDVEIGPPELSFRVTRYVKALFESRDDLRLTFGSPWNGDSIAFERWLRSHGVFEAHPRLVAAALRESAPRSLAESPVRLVGYLRSESGVGEAARSILSALNFLSCPVSIVDISASAPSRSEHRVPFQAARYAPGITVVCVNADRLIEDARVEFESWEGPIVAAWWWELPTFPRSAWPSLPLSEVWVGSQFVHDAISATAEVPVVRIPPIIPVDAVPERETGDERHQSFTFLYTFDYLSIYERKNPEAVIDAFARAFTPEDEVRLVLKTINGEHFPEQRSRLCRRTAVDGRIDHIEGYYSRGEMRELVKTCDAYVSLHRAEGFGLSIAEAMSRGKPVVATAWSGNMDYMNDWNSIPVSYRLVPIVEHYGPYRAGQFWAEPDIDDAAAAMRRIWREPDLARELGGRARATIEGQYSTVAAATRIAERLMLLTR